MSNESLNEVQQLLLLAKELESKAQAIAQLAQKLCTHKKSDGTWNVDTGFPVGVGEAECGYCKLEDCYIPGYKK